MIKAAAIVLALAAAAAPAAAARRARTPIRHVVIVYQENHSYDEVMGQFCAAHPRRRCGGPRIGSTVSLADGARVTVRTEPDIVPFVAHQPDSQKLGAAGRWDHIAGCKPETNYACIAAVPAASARNLYAAALHGVIATRMFEAWDHASWPAHFELISADDDGFTGFNPVPAPGRKGAGGGCRVPDIVPWQDPKTGEVSQQPACIPDYTLAPTSFPAGWPATAGGAFEPTPVKHIPNLWEDRLNPAGLSWKEYIDSPKTNNTIWNICTSFASCIYTADANNVVLGSRLIDDAANGTLPAVSIAIPEGPAGVTSQHNGTSFVAGDNQIGSYLSALSHGPQWRSTAVFILYDDCGCFYDHVTPPPGMGPRVPFVLSSPWAKHGTTYRHRVTTASLLGFIEYNWRLVPLSHVDAGADKLRGMFDFHQKPSSKPVAVRQRAVPASSQRYLRTHPVSRLDGDNT